MRRLGRLSFVDYVLWGLRIAVVIGVAIGTWATLSAGRLEGDQWRSLVILGIAQGSLYALIALGYTLVYGVLLMINFAHGDVFMFGAMTAFFVADGLADGGLLTRQSVHRPRDRPDRRDAQLDDRRDPPGAHRLSSAAARTAARPAHHRDRSIALHQQQRARHVRRAGEGLPEHPGPRGPHRHPRHPDPEDPGARHRDRHSSSCSSCTGSSSARARDARCAR